METHELFGTELPIIQAPMAGVQDSALAVAVSSAGGLGSLPCAMLDADTIRAELTAIRSRTTKPFNVNFFCHQPPEPDPVSEATWRALLAPYFAEFGVEPGSIDARPARTPFGSDAAELLAEFRPAVVSFHFGLPAAELLSRVRSWGAKVISSATTVQEAVWLERQGVDAVIAQGFEAGGHRGMFLADDVSTQVGTFALVPQVVRAVNIPVVAAGGIVDARGVRAALSLGASGVQIGTSYLLTPEAATSAVHRAALKRESARDTALTNLLTGRPARSIVNRLIRELGPIHPAAPRFPLAASVIAPLRAAAEAAGRDDFSPLWAGQNVSGCSEVPAAVLTRALAGELRF